MVFLSKSLARDRLSPMQPFIEGGWILLAVMLGWTLINKILFIKKENESCCGYKILRNDNVISFTLNKKECSIFYLSR